VVKITGSATAVGRAEVSADGHEGMIRSMAPAAATAARDCRSRLQWRRIDSEQARGRTLFATLGGGAPATIAPDRILKILWVSR